MTIGASGQTWWTATEAAAPFGGTLSPLTLATCLELARFLDLARFLEMSPASVPIPKFLCTFYVCVECAAAEAFDGCEDVIGGFCPAERLGRGISDFDISGDRGFQ